jgi:hypothetical protein
MTTANERIEGFSLIIGSRKMYDLALEDGEFAGNWGFWESTPYEEAEFWFGSYLGASNFFRGFIGDIEFSY